MLPMLLSTTPAYLFAWNPKKWEWLELEVDIAKLQAFAKVTIDWSCTSYRRIRPGDRIFLVKLGSLPRGIMASGRVISEPFAAPHWNGQDKQVQKVKLELDVLLNPDSEKILTLDQLQEGKLGEQHWTPMSSGIPIADAQVVQELEEAWFKFLARSGHASQFVDEVSAFVEGGMRQVMQTRYERNPHARAVCLASHGYACKVCTMNFEQVYGNIGYRFIHVHHLTPVSAAKGPYELDPLIDLIPVCPNCHAMLHRQKPPLSPEELRQRMN
jgi:5-methylcytosine-specific restriction protein A